MDTDVGALVAIAKSYFDAAYEMDADKFEIAGRVPTPNQA
jgi:hypothetical protein